MEQVLLGHTNPESAYVVDDYPYGFRLRTKIRYWIETKKGYGQRFVSQTINPKTGRLNKPKAGTYCTILVMYLDENGHVQNDGLWMGASNDTIDAFEQRFAEALTGNREREALRYMRARNRATSKMKWTVTSHVCTLRPDCEGCAEAGPRQTIEEQAAIVRAATRHELWQEARAEYPA